MARIAPADRRMCSHESTTGAACTRLVVNTAAAAAGASLVISAKSRLFFFFKPQAVAENRKPCGSTTRFGVCLERRMLLAVIPGPRVL